MNQDLWKKKNISSTRFFWVGELTFSPDGKNYAYLASDDRETLFIVYNNNIQKGIRFDNASSIIFSSDSKNYACFILKNDELFILVNNKIYEKSYEYFLDIEYYEKENCFIYIVGRNNNIYLGRIKFK